MWRLYKIIHQKHLWMQSFGWSLLLLFLLLLLHLFLLCHWGRGIARQCCNLRVIFAISCSLRRILGKASVLMLHKPELRSLVMVEELLMSLKLHFKLFSRLWRRNEHRLLWSLQFVLETGSLVFGRTHALRGEMRRWHLVLLLHKMAIHTHIKLWGIAVTRRTIDIKHKVVIEVIRSLKPLKHLWITKHLIQLMTLHQMMEIHWVIIEVMSVEMDWWIQWKMSSLRCRHRWRSRCDRAANYWIVDVVLVCEVNGVVAELAWMHIALGSIRWRETRVLLLHVALHSLLVVSRVRICSHEWLQRWTHIMSGAPLWIVNSLTIIDGPHRSRCLIYSSTLGKCHRRAA